MRVLVIDNDGNHGLQSISNTINLSAGLHDLRMDFVNNNGGGVATLSYTPVGGASIVIPTTALFFLLLAPMTVDRRHILRNALLPVSTIIGLQTGLLLSGAVLTETVFAFPGMGSWLRDAIFNRDYPVLQGGILFLALVFVFVNLIVDISYAIINPRIRYS